MAAKPKPEPAATNYPVIRDKKIVAAVEEYATAHEQSKLIEARLKELKPTIEAALDGAPVAYIGKRVVSITAFDATPSTENVVITKAMVGQIIPGKAGRKGYTQLKVQ